MPDLPILPDQDTLTLLIRTRQFLVHALSHSNGNSGLDRMITIHGLDSSNENLLKIVAQHLKVEDATGENLDSADLSTLAGKVGRFLKNEHRFTLPYVSEIKQIRRIRNLVQHGMVDAGPEIPRCRTITERFFDRVLVGVFGLEREEIRVSSVVASEEVKRHLVTAEQRIDEGKFLQSVVASRNAFESALFERTDRLNLRLSALPVLAQTRVERLTEHWFYSQMLDELEFLRLGLDMAQYDRYTEYIRHIPGEYRVKSEYHWTEMQRPWQREDANFCYSFVAEAVLKWQDQEKPPLYPPLSESALYTRSTIIDGVDVSSGVSPRNVVIGDEGSIEQFFVDANAKDNFNRLKTDVEYESTWKMYKDGELDSEGEAIVKIKAKLIRLVTHDPERWSCTIWYAPYSELNP